MFVSKRWYNGFFWVHITPIIKKIKKKVLIKSYCVLKRCGRWPSDALLEKNSVAAKCGISVQDTF